MKKFFSDVAKELDGLNYGIVALSKFGFLIGGILLLLTGLSLYHDKLGTGLAIGIPGTILFALGVLAPMRLKILYRYWMGLAFLLGAIVGPVILSFIYFFILTPISLVMLLVSGNPLEKKTKEGSYWIPRTDGFRKESMEQMF